MSDELLIAWSLKATVILIAAHGLCFILHRASAAARHLVWIVAFAALLLLPILSRVTPGSRAPCRTSSSSPVAAHPAAALSSPPPTAHPSLPPPCVLAPVLAFDPNRVNSS